MIYTRKLPIEIDQSYIIEHHKHSRNLIFAVLGYLYLLKTQREQTIDDATNDYYREIEDYCFQILEHEKKLMLILLLHWYRQSLSSGQLN